MLVKYGSDKVRANLQPEAREREIEPLEKKMSKDEDGVHFQDKTINILGLSKRSTHLNDWIVTLEKYDWIDEILVVNYTQDNEINAGEFNLEVRLN